MISLLARSICTAALLIGGITAQAEVTERYIVKYNANAHGLKLGHAVKAQGKDWFAVELTEKGKSALRNKAGVKSIEIDPKRFPMSI